MIENRILHYNINHICLVIVSYSFSITSLFFSEIYYFHDNEYLCLRVSGGNTFTSVNLYRFGL